MDCLASVGCWAGSLDAYYARSPDASTYSCCCWSAAGGDKSTEGVCIIGSGTCLLSSSSLFSSGSSSCYASAYCFAFFFSRLSCLLYFRAIFFFLRLRRSSSEELSSLSASSLLDSSSLLLSEGVDLYRLDFFLFFAELVCGGELVFSGRCIVLESPFGPCFNVGVGEVFSPNCDGLLAFLDPTVSIPISLCFIRICRRASF